MNLYCIVAADLLRDLGVELARQNLRIPLGNTRYAFVLERLERLVTVPAEGEIEVALAGRLEYRMRFHVELTLRLSPSVVPAVAEERLQLRARLIALDVKPLVPKFGENAIRALVNRYLPSPLFDLDLAALAPIPLRFPTSVRTSDGRPVSVDLRLRKAQVEVIDGGLRIAGDLEFESD